MSVIRLSFDIDAPLSQVWELGTNPSRIPEWQFDVIDVLDAPNRIESVGQTYSIVYRRFGRDLPSAVEVTKFNPKHLVETSGNTPLGGYFKSETVMTPEKNRTHIYWTMEYKLPGWFIGSLMDLLLFRHAFKKTVQKYNLNYKAIAEGKSPPIKRAS